jgi:hypothetical protein
MKLRRIRINPDRTPLSQWLRRLENVNIEHSRENDPARSAFVDSLLTRHAMVAAAAQAQAVFDLAA